MWFWLAIAAIAVMWWWYRTTRPRQTITDAHRKYVMITGCDSGFGSLAAHRLHEFGFNVICTCISDEGVARYENLPRVTALKMNLMSEESIQDTCDQVKQILPHDTGLWGLINNAGVLGVVGEVEWIKRDELRSCMEINFFGHVTVTRLLLPVLRTARGRVVNTSSIMGRYALPGLLPYNASKFAMQAFSDCLRKSVGMFGIHVCTVDPGFFKTALTESTLSTSCMKRKYNELPADLKNVYGDEWVTYTVEKSIPALLSRVTSDKVHLVADAYFDAVTAVSPKTRYTVGNDAKFFFRPQTVLPDYVQDQIAAFMSRNKPKPAYVISRTSKQD